METDAQLFWKSLTKGAEKTVGFISESLDFLKAERSDLDNSSDRPKGILLLETPESVRILALISSQISGPCERSVTVVELSSHVSRGGTIMNNWKVTSSSCRQSAVVRRIPLMMIVVIGSLAAAYAVFGVSGWATATSAPAQVSGMARMSGTVSSSKPFKAAQVYIRNVDMRIMYMVFTNAGQFRAVSLFPGNYEISVTAKGFKSNVQKLAVKAGDNPKIKVSLQEVANSNEGEADPLQNVETLASNRIKVSFDLYENIYPSGAGRDVAERTCIICHGENFLPSQPGSAAVWNARVDRMMGKANFDRAANSYAEGLLSYRAQQFRFSRQDREDLVAYMVKNFGPGAPPRNVRTVQETPLQ